MNTAHNHLPPPIAGAVWECLSVAELAQINSLINRIESYDNPVYRTNLSQISEVYADSSEYCCVGARDTDTGKLVAYGQAVPHANRSEIICMGGVHPKYRGRGFGVALIAWLKQQSERLLAAKDGGKIIFYVEESRGDLVDILVKQGYITNDGFIDMEHKLLHPVTDVILEYPLEMLAWQKDLDDLLRRSLNRVLQLELGNPPISAEEWRRGSRFISPEHSFVVLDKTSDRWQVAGFALSSVSHPAWQGEAQQGQINLLVISPNYSETPIAKALLAQVLNSFNGRVSSVVASLPLNNADVLKDVFIEIGFNELAVCRRYEIEYH